MKHLRNYFYEFIQTTILSWAENVVEKNSNCVDHKIKDSLIPVKISDKYATRANSSQRCCRKHFIMFTSLS